MKGEVFSKAGITKRIIAFSIDLYSVMFLFILIIYFMMRFKETEILVWPVVEDFMLVLVPACFVLFLARDCIKGNSIGKWIMGIRVHRMSDGRIPSVVKLFLRNLTLVIWPAEFIILVSGRQRIRLGDRFLHTDVIQNKRTPDPLLRIVVLFVIVGGFIILIVFFAHKLMENSKVYAVAVEQIMHDEEILHDTGGIMGFDKLNKQDFRISDEKASFTIKVKGKKNDVILTIYLEKDTDSIWKVINIEED